MSVVLTRNAATRFAVCCVQCPCMEEQGVLVWICISGVQGQSPCWGYWTSIRTRSAAVCRCKWADRTALSGIAVQHADEGYFRRGNVDASLVRNMVLIDWPTSMVQEVHGKFEGKGSV